VVHQPGVVHLGERGAEGLRQLHHVLGVELAANGEQIVEGHAPREIGAQPVRSVGRGGQRERGRRLRAAQPHRLFGRLDEALLGAGVGKRGARDPPERDLAALLDALGAVVRHRAVVFDQLELGEVRGYRDRLSREARHLCDRGTSLHRW
jgi:hypothetical protein